MPVDERLADLAAWVARYEQAWRTAGTDPLAGLFTEDATYLPAPFEATLRGLRAIEAFWEAERDGADEAFTLTWEPVAVQGDVAVARVEVVYEAPPPRRYRDLWIVTLDADGRARAFEEWPSFPGQERASS